MQPLRKIIVALVFLTATANSRAGDIVLVGKLEKMALNVPGCGVFMVNSVGEYRVMAVLNGTYAHSNIKVVHACIEMPRERFSKDAGTLQAFRIGDLHKMVITDADIHGELSIRKRSVPTYDESLYSCKRVDLYRNWQLWLHNIRYSRRAPERKG